MKAVKVVQHRHVEGGGDGAFLLVTAHVHMIMIVAAVLMYTNYDKVIQVKVLELFPSYGNLLSSVENNDHVAKQLRVLRKEVPILEKSTEGDDALADMGPAVDFVGITQWLNGPALNLEQLRGKVVLVDFWTYSCVNCVRTLPHVTGWYGKYKDNGFVVIGVHTPEFAFEKQANNVQNALKQFKINYPVALDNNFGTWQAYHNHYWPAEYLIDVKGHLRHTHFGEGHYDQMEKAIRALLKEAGNTLDVGLSNNEDMTPQYGRTPETYLGSSRIERFVSYQKPNGQQQSFTHPKKIPKDQFAFEGMWQVSDESAKAGNGAALEFHFKASKVFLVMGPSAEGGRVNVFIDGKPVDASIAGADVNQGVITLDSERLYDLINLKGKVEEHVLRLEFNGQDTEVYAFTFG